MSARSAAVSDALPRVGVVSVHYYLPYLESSARAAVDLARRTGAEVFVAIANHPGVAQRLPQVREVACFPRVINVTHDNTGLEFGAYQAGIEALRALDPDWILILNDTVSVWSRHSGGPPMRRRLSLPARWKPSAARLRSSAAGRIAGSRAACSH